MKNHIKFLLVIFHSFVWSCGIVAEGEIVCGDKKAFKAIKTTINNQKEYNADGRSILKDAQVTSVILDPCKNLICSKKEYLKKISKKKLSQENRDKLEIKSEDLNTRKTKKSLETIEKKSTVKFEKKEIKVVRKMLVESVQTYNETLSNALREVKDDLATTIKTNKDNRNQVLTKIVLPYLLCADKNLENYEILIKKLLSCDDKNQWKYLLSKYLNVLKDNYAIDIENVEELCFDLNKFLHNNQLLDLQQEFNIDGEHLSSINHELRKISEELKTCVGELGAKGISENTSTESIKSQRKFISILRTLAGVIFGITVTYFGFALSKGFLKDYHPGSSMDPVFTQMSLFLMIVYPTLWPFLTAHLVLLAASASIDLSVMGAAIGLPIAAGYYTAKAIWSTQSENTDDGLDFVERREQLERELGENCDEKARNAVSTIFASINQLLGQIQSDQVSLAELNEFSLFYNGENVDEDEISSSELE